MRYQLFVAYSSIFLANSLTLSTAQYTNEHKLRGSSQGSQCQFSDDQQRILVDSFVRAMNATSAGNDGGVVNEMQQLKLETGEMRQMLQQLQTAVARLTHPLGQQQCNDSVEKVDYPNARDCADIRRAAPGAASGVYTIDGNGFVRIRVYCDMTTSGGGWTVFQRRQDGSENFYRPWNEYAVGFGQLTGEFWLGNDNLAALTAGKQYRLRIDLQDWDNYSRYAEYTLFKMGDATTNYSLASLGSYSGNANDSLTYHTGHMFSTYDRHNDVNPTSCAQAFRGAWWYRSCHHSNLNGEYNNTHFAKGVTWLHWHGYLYSLRFSEMKIRPVYW